MWRDHVKRVGDGHGEFIGAMVVLIRIIHPLDAACSAGGERDAAVRRSISFFDVERQDFQQVGIGGRQLAMEFFVLREAGEVVVQNDDGGVLHVLHGDFERLIVDRETLGVGDGEAEDIDAVVIIMWRISQREF